MAKKPKIPAPVTNRQTVNDAFVTILKHNFSYLGQWEQTARSWADIEGVHQMRVAFRRMRSALCTFRPAIPHRVTAAWSEEMRWLANQFGPARDLDVYIDEVLEPLAGVLPLPGEQQMLILAQRKRKEAYDQLRLMLDGERYARFKQEFSQWLDDKAWLREELKPKHRKRLHANIIPFARKRLDHQTHDVLAAGNHVDQNSAEQMHKLRIECKKLRYTAEFFTPLFHGTQDFISHMKGLQDLLGVMHDVAVMKGLLADLLDGQTDPELLQYAGGLVGWRTRQYFELKDSFNARWDEFSQAKRPWWNKG